MNAIAKTVYGLLGVGFLLAGLATFFVQRGEEHLIIEFGSSLIAIGILSLLIAIRFADSHPWRIVVIVFFFMMAAVHIGEYLRGMVPTASPLINSIPFITLLAVEFAVRRGSESATKRQSR